MLNIKIFFNWQLNYQPNNIQGYVKRELFDFEVPFMKL